MAAFDKLNKFDALLALGWRAATDAEKSAAGLTGNEWALVPPATLWEDRPTCFHVYDAEDLQDLLCPSPKPDTLT